MPQELPSKLIAGRFFVTPRTRDGETLELFTDTGGGMFLYASAVKRLGLPSETVDLGAERVELVSLPEFDPAARIPPVSMEDDPRHPALRGRVVVFPDGGSPLDFGDGLLGQPWFGGRIWTFDYASGRLLVHAPTGDVQMEDAHTMPMGFPVDAAGRRVTHFPSIEAVVDGETRQFLFDTGASVSLTDAALRKLGDGGPAERATSFIVGSAFDRWTERRDWRVIEDADMSVPGQPMIEVPEVTVAGRTAGPVWFTRRPDPNSTTRCRA